VGGCPTHHPSRARTAGLGAGGLLLTAFLQAFRTPDLRKKLLFTLAVIGLFRLGSHVPTPGVDAGAINYCLQQTKDNSLYALIKLLTVVIPRFEALKKEGQAGTTRLTQYTRYLTVALAILQSTVLVTIARTPGRLVVGCNRDILNSHGIFPTITMIATLTAGTAVIMWLGELITDRGVGNGMSLLIFTQIIATFPSQLWRIKQQSQVGGGWPVFLLVIAVGLVLVAVVIYVEQAQRRVPVQYAKRMIGRRMYGGTSTYIPLKVNQAGVIPVIFASSLLYLPSLVVSLTDQTNPPAWATWVSQHLVRGDHPIYMVTYFLLIVFFTYFYVAITFNPTEVADNMKKYGGFIPGIRAGRPTAEYLDYVLTRLTAPGSLYLGVIALIPMIALALFNASQQFPFGGTSILIMVGVGLDTVKQIEGQLQQRNYEGFLR
jgi:preprotein translocase subunit SecY